MFKADAKQFDNYLARPHRGHVVAYWEGGSTSQNPKWEYLLDGAIKAIDDAEVAKLCKSHLESGAPPWSVTNPAPIELVELAAQAR